MMILVDANIFLEVLLDQSAAEDCVSFLNHVKEGRISAVFTDFAIDSIIMVLESRNKNPKEIRLFLVSLLEYRGLDLYNLTLFDRISATTLMEKHKLDFDDATAYQTMIGLKIDKIVSFDKHFAGLPDINCLKPSEVSLPG